MSATLSILEQYQDKLHRDLQTNEHNTRKTVQRLAALEAERAEIEAKSADLANTLKLISIGAQAIAPLKASNTSAPANLLDTATVTYSSTQSSQQNSPKSPPEKV